MDSLWRKTVSLPRFEGLKADLKTDVLIIGGGMAGVLCAYMLEQAGVDYALVEADRICGGVTGDTTAKITAQHGLIYHQLLHRFGEEKAKLYLQAISSASFSSERILFIPDMMRRSWKKRWRYWSGWGHRFAS